MWWLTFLDPQIFSRDELELPVAVHLTDIVHGGLTLPDTMTTAPPPVFYQWFTHRISISW